MNRCKLTCLQLCNSDDMCNPVGGQEVKNSHCRNKGKLLLCRLRRHYKRETETENHYVLDINLQEPSLLTRCPGADLSGCFLDPY